MQILGDLINTNYLIGCWICSFRKLKCTQNKPHCQQCSEFDLTCEYGRPEWWYDEELRGQVSTDIKAKTAKRKPKTKRKQVQAQAPTASSTEDPSKRNNPLRGNATTPTSDDNSAIRPSKRRKARIAHSSDDSAVEPPLKTIKAEEM